MSRDFNPPVVHALILRISGLGLLMGKFLHCLTELFARHMIVAGYYNITFLFWKKIGTTVKEFNLYHSLAKFSR